MERSILNSTKQKLGLKDLDNHDFDDELIDYINAALAHCWQLNIGVKTGYAIESEDDTWDDFLGEYADDPRFSVVKSFVFLHTKMIFDTPIGTVNSTLKELYNEYEWRLSILKEVLE